MLATLVCLSLSLPTAAIDAASSPTAAADVASSWVLALQLCQGASTYTLHGLWPPNNDCSGPAFSESDILSIESQMKTYWPSCVRR